MARWSELSTPPGGITSGGQHGSFHTPGSLDYHSEVRPGKIEVVPVKPYSTQKHLTMAYSPGVAESCLAIAKDPDLTYKYTAVATSWPWSPTAPPCWVWATSAPTRASRSWKARALFKIFADVDVYDINLDVTDPDKLCEIVKAMEPTFGGINLEDIKSRNASTSRTSSKGNGHPGLP
jgi:Malic enzyme